MTLRQIWKEVAERIFAGDRDEPALVEDTIELIDANDHGAEIVRRYVTKQIRDLISTAVKPSGDTSRVPAGQQSFDWYEMEPPLALRSLRHNVRMAYAKMARATTEAQILGIIDSSGLDPTAYHDFRALCNAAHVPEELVEALAR